MQRSLSMPLLDWELSLWLVTLALYCSLQRQESQASTQAPRNCLAGAPCQVGPSTDILAAF